MTAQVAIRVETLDDVLQVPIQAVIERGGEYYCVRRTESSVEPWRVLVGSTNEKFLVIRQGLAAGDEVLLNPRSHLSRVNLEEIAPITAARAGESQQVGARPDSRRVSATMRGSGS